MARCLCLLRVRASVRRLDEPTYTNNEYHLMSMFSNLSIRREKRPPTKAIFLYANCTIVQRSFFFFFTLPFPTPRVRQLDCWQLHLLYCRSFLNHPCSFVDSRRRWRARHAAELPVLPTCHQSHCAGISGRWGGVGSGDRFSSPRGTAGARAAVFSNSRGSPSILRVSCLASKSFRWDWAHRTYTQSSQVIGKEKTSKGGSTSRHDGECFWPFR